MCGFSFCISKNKIRLNEIKLMNKRISHRGPDREKIINSDNIKEFKYKNKINFFVGFRRLKIIDFQIRQTNPCFTIIDI